MNVRLVLMSRAYCHLCDEMRSAVTRLLPQAVLDEHDVDADPALESSWGDKVPVLLLDGREICHYRLDARALMAALAAQGVDPQSRAPQ